MIQINVERDNNESTIARDAQSWFFFKRRLENWA